MNTSTSFVPSLNNQIDLSKVEGFNITWAEDNKHILFESPTSLFSYNITDRLMYTLLNSNTNTPDELSNKVWTTTGDGYLYYLSDNTDSNSSVYSYSIESISLDGVKEESFVKNYLYAKR